MPRQRFKGWSLGDQESAQYALGWLWQQGQMHCSNLSLHHMDPERKQSFVVDEEPLMPDKR